jgi:hypothetical protein
VLVPRIVPRLSCSADRRSSPNVAGSDCGAVGPSAKIASPFRPQIVAWDSVFAEMPAAVSGRDAASALRAGLRLER